MLAQLRMRLEADSSEFGYYQSSNMQEDMNKKILFSPVGGNRSDKIFKGWLDASYLQVL